MNNKGTGFFRKVITTPFYFFFFGSFPLFSVWANNRIQIKPVIVFPTLIVNSIIIIGIWLILLLIYRSINQASKYCLGLFFLFFSYGHIYDVIKKDVSLVANIGFLKLLVIYLVIGILWFILARKIHISKSTTILLNIISVGIIFYNLSLILTTIASTSTNEQNASLQDQSNQESETLSAGKNPDIYYIILDAYSRQDVLLNTFNYDNTEFIEGLEQRGFYVADCSNSNYDGTLTSIASSLNFSYENTYQIEGDILAESTEGSYFSIENNEMRKKLSALGYQFVAARGYSAFIDVKNADIYLDVIKDPDLQYSIQQSQFGHLYAMTTILRYVFELYTSNPSKYAFIPAWFEIGEGNDNIDTARYWYYQTNYVFDSLKELPKENADFFVYAHINSPHGPFVFDQNGNFRFSPDPADMKPYYNDSIIYLNKRVLDLVDTLISESEQPPIIIIQADHGSHYFPSGFDKNKILNAYFLPNGKVSSLYKTITPVNTFRLILREYFGEDIDLLPDQIYVKDKNDYEVYPSTCDEN